MWKEVISDISVGSFPPGRVYEREFGQDSVGQKALGEGVPVGFWLHANWREGHGPKKKLLGTFGANFTVGE